MGGILSGVQMPLVGPCWGKFLQATSVHVWPHTIYTDVPGPQNNSVTLGPSFWALQWRIMRFATLRIG